MGRLYLISIKFLSIILFMLFSPILRGQSYTDEDGIRMRQEAEELAKAYFYGLNEIGKVGNYAERFREDNIENFLTNYTESTESLIYNDLIKDNPDTSYITAREYVNLISELYPNGVKYTTTFSLKSPCYQQIDDESFYFVKVEADKKLEGLLSTANATNINRVPIDLYVKFPILQNRPTLNTGPARVYFVQIHSETECIESQEGETRTISDFEENIIKERAENFIKDYALTLNVIGNENMDELFNTKDYFESELVKVHNDIIPYTLLEDFNADAYLNNIDKWFQEGAIFDFQSIRATNILIKEDYVSVEVEVERVLKVPARNFRDRQTLSIFVKFPIDPDGTVGIERMTPRIYRIEPRGKKLNPRNYLAIGAQVNVMNYFGDLNPINAQFRPTYNLTRIGIGIEATKKLSSRFFARASLHYGQVIGDDFTAADPNTASGQYRYLRNLHFRNFITELAVVGIYDIIPSTGLYYKRRFFTPYVFGGIAIFHHNPQARTPVDLGNAWINLRPLRTEGQGVNGNRDPYSPIQIAIPYGLGVKFRMSYRLDVSFEIGLRYTLFDYLDDVSGFYPDPNDLPEGIARVMYTRSLEGRSALNGRDRSVDLAALQNRLGLGTLTLPIGGEPPSSVEILNGFGRRGDQRGSSDSNDFYMITGFHISYLIKVGRTKKSTERPRKGRIDFNYD